MVEDVPFRFKCIQSCQREKRYWKKDEVYESFIDMVTNYPADFEVFAGDLILDAPNGFYKDLDGTLYANGHYGWNDENFPVSIVNPPGLASDPDISSVDGSLLFDASSTELIFIWSQLNHKVLPGSTIRPHIHWTATTANAGNVLWDMEYKVLLGNQTTVVGFTSTTTEVAEASQTHMIHRLEDITLPSSGILSAMLNFKISRLGGDGTDTYADDAKLFEFDYHYKTNVILGSGRELQL